MIVKLEEKANRLTSSKENQLQGDCQAPLESRRAEHLLLSLAPPPPKLRRHQEDLCTLKE